ncbi:GNAT family N-acetyltransferase [Symbiobacterium thermophilum]|nr:GNAT family N-acetyltransferase [Symbiobacterium thermophilum]
MSAAVQDKPVLIVTRTGRLVTIRPCTPADAPLIAAMYQRLSPRSMRFRYCSGLHIHEEEEAARLCGGDPDAGVVLLALSEGEVVAVGELGQVDEECAEIALLVRDDCQGEGIGTALGQELVEAARERGFTRLVAYMLAENQAMRRIIRGLPFRRTWDSGCGELCVTVELDRPAVLR